MGAASVTTSLGVTFSVVSALRKSGFCENPAVAEAAAERLGQTCLPLVCRPSSAAWTLLRGLAGAGVRLLVTADRDDVGRRFLTEVLSLPGATEWLTDVDGVYEDARLDALITDLTPALNVAATRTTDGPAASGALLARTD